MSATEPRPRVEAEASGRLTGTTRRSFIRGIAAAGAGTMAAYGLDRSGTTALFGETAMARTSMPFADFEAIAASAADRVEVPEGFRADVLIAWGDTFKDARGNTFEYGFNNDFIAFFPLEGDDDGLLFVNHEYPAPFYLHGFKPDAAGVAEGKSAADIDLERRSVGNSVLHIHRGRHGLWKVVSRSRYNRRIYGGVVDGAPRAELSRFDVTGPLAGNPRVGTSIEGSIGNCSGGITPWGTAISCEENFDGYGLPLAVDEENYGWADAGFPQYDPGSPYREDSADEHARYGWVCEHDPYDPDGRPRKHTALGRFRHENTAFRHVPGKRFVLYMGDDKANEAVYKFVSDGRYEPGIRGGANRDRWRPAPCTSRAGSPMAAAASPRPATPSRSPPRRAPAPGWRCATTS